MEVRNTPLGIKAVKEQWELSVLINVGSGGGFLEGTALAWTGVG